MRSRRLEIWPVLLTLINNSNSNNNNSSPNSNSSSSE
ncbi:unnamed protein product [Strongylus vulgaris]|uniref:Uncharacterized protein n=1 Tax=Strongylus vulgaris TaxID=40348 RepID=A0A3P7KLZ2_STRVU|nr:unnamed protein product [Strongylus vulgaris]